MIENSFQIIFLENSVNSKVMKSHSGGLHQSHKNSRLVSNTSLCSSSYIRLLRQIKINGKAIGAMGFVHGFIASQQSSQKVGRLSHIKYLE